MVLEQCEQRLVVVAGDAQVPVDTHVGALARGLRLVERARGQRGAACERRESLDPAEQLCDHLPVLRKFC